MRAVKNNQSNLSDQVYDYIKHMILSGEIKGGEKIPEEKVGQLFGVSRTPIREALRRLHQYGLVHIKPRSYAVVVSLDRQEVIQLAYIRAQLETLSVRLLTNVGTPADFDCLDSLAEECDLLIDRDDIASAAEIDNTLHLEIAKRTKSVHLYEIFEKLDAKIQLSKAVIALPIDRLKASVNQHTKIIDTMRDGYPDLAESLMKHHILHQIRYYDSDKN